MYEAGPRCAMTRRARPTTPGATESITFEAGVAAVKKSVCQLTNGRELRKLLRRRR